ncbi:MAG: spore germination YkwD domain-containing protein [Acidimicrobiales bacterium]
MICAIALAPLGTTLPGAGAAAPLQAASANPVESQIAGELSFQADVERLTRGEGAMAISPYLQQMAQAWVDAVAAGEQPAGDPSSAWEAYYQALHPCGSGCPGWLQSVFADGTPSPSGLFTSALMSSGIHREILLTPQYSVTGAGVRCSGAGEYTDQLLSANSPPVFVPAAPYPIVTSASAGSPCPSGGVPSATECPEPPASPLPDAVAVAAADEGGCGGYDEVDSAGQVRAFGSASWHGDLTGVNLAAPIIAITPTADGGGYYLLGADGGVFALGDAVFHGSTGGMALNAPVISMAVAPGGAGYWLVSADGGVFSFGVPFYGSTGNLVLNQPVDGVAAAPGGDGYWLVARDGGVFSFTPDGFHGSMGASA